jgi:hypothetical protein
MNSKCNDAWTSIDLNARISVGGGGNLYYGKYDSPINTSLFGLKKNIANAIHV